MTHDDEDGSRGAAGTVAGRATGRAAGGASGRASGRAGGRPAGGASARAGGASAAAPASGVRASVVRRTGPLLVVLHRAPRWVPFVVVLALVLCGALLPEPAAGVALLVLAVLLAWLLLLAWPALTGGGRTVRATTTALVLGLAATRLG